VLLLNDEVFKRSSVILNQSDLKDKSVLEHRHLFRFFCKNMKFNITILGKGLASKTL